ncbi:HIT family protein [Polyangium aurulentum]|uniref:HIT family protein n=1 Tax=Polyangium aurulentum TaxID=2567896 RepID=UPI0010AEC71F|nr:HIT family protein [Polyangium aurulentum]UQA55859.1 HIT family protein [Polyangium aurulentum]
MSNWRDPEAWSALRSGEACPICLDGGPRDVLAQLEASWVTMGDDGPMRGYVCLLFRRHAVELHDLDDAEGAAFMRDIRRVSRALAVVTGAVKLNYEVHGNTLPHLHMHFFPRYVGDPFEGRPIDPRSVKMPVYAPGELAGMRRRILEELGAGAEG